MLYIDELLELVKQRFVELFLTLVPPNTPHSSVVLSVQFEDEFNDILERVETTTKKRSFKQRTFEETSRGKDIIKDPKKKDKKKDKKDKKDKKNGDGDDEDDEEADGSPQEPGESEVEKKKKQFIGN